jgi:hypothetical protein
MVESVSTTSMNLSTSGCRVVLSFRNALVAKYFDVFLRRITKIILKYRDQAAIILDIEAMRNSVQMTRLLTHTRLVPS